MSLEIEGARKVYRARRGGHVPALDGASLRAQDGELLVVVGPSGSGKSTLLRAVAGLERLDGGTVRLGGRNVTHLPPGRRDVAMVFQDSALFPHLSVAGNIGVGERARGGSRALVADRVRAVAALLGIDALLRRMPGELSGGERQRVALARAMMRSPEVYLLDEPLASLDADLRLRMRAEIKAVQRRLGATMLHVTHDQLEAMAMGDRIAVIHEGRIAACDSPEALYARPDSLFVAQFFGALPMNLFHARNDVVVGVRPERLRLAGVADGSDGVEAKVASVEAAGEDCVVRLEPVVAATGSPLMARLPWDHRPGVGDPVRAVWRAEDEHRFDATTGARR
jgi:ABC-type sugar transport system ATPase subunit